MDNEFLMFDTVSEVYDFICQKCNDGEDISALNSDERIIYIVQTLEQEVNGGGFSQFFYNSSGDFAGEMVDAFREIGAEKTAAICQQALDAVGQPLPGNRAERIELLEKIETDALTEALNACDDAFYAYPEDLNALTDAYVKQHQAEFA